MEGVMRPELYIHSVKCPVCEHGFDVYKVKSDFVKVKNRDSDFCTYYETIDPLWYDVWVCEKCGYAAQQSKWDNISGAEKEFIKKKITPKWTKRAFYPDRDIDKVIEMFKLAYLSYVVRGSKNSILARVCIRIAWLYRQKNDEREYEYLKIAVKNYREAYSRESFPIDNLDEPTCMYIIAEMYRRLREYKSSIEWFGRVITDQEARKNQNILEKSREQLAIAKAELKEIEDKDLEVKV